MFPDRLKRVVQLLSRLPGVGEKTAQRYAVTLVTGDPSTARELARELADLHRYVKPCSMCGNLAEVDAANESAEVVCRICTDSRRDQSLLCVVARVQDLMAIEKSGSMRGRYFVLDKLLSPLEGVTRDDIGLDRLIDRVRSANPPITEILVATPPSVDGEATALLLAREVGPMGASVSRIASGVPHGGDLEFSDRVTLGRAIEYRRKFS